MVFLACLDHFAALIGIDSHWRFAKHVLACIGRSQGKLAMHRIWHSDVNDVDRFVVRDSVERFVAVKILARESVLCSVGLRLAAIARYESSQAAIGA